MWKWSHATVVCGAAGDGNGVLRLWVDDDGPGIVDHDRLRLLRRGQRNSGPEAAGAGGQGIGLAVVQDIVNAYDGVLSLQHSALGGLRVMLEFHGNAHGAARYLGK